MNNKYEFVAGDEKQLSMGQTLKRIRAIVNISTFVVIGDLGGYIESEHNLSQDGNAWVSGDARVYGNAWVYGNARVSGDAQVSGDAWVSGNAALIWFSNVGRDNGTLTAFMGKDQKIILTRGCFIGSIDEFLTKSEQEHDDKTHLEYRLLIEVAHSRLTRTLI